MSLYDFGSSVSFFFWFMTAMFTALALFSRMAAAASSSSSFMVALRFWVKGQLQPTLAKMCRLAAVSSNNASVTFAQLVFRMRLGEIMILLLSQSLSRHLCLT